MNAVSVICASFPSDYRDYAEHVDDDTEPDLVRWRRDLHQSLELSFEEFETTEYVAGMLDQWAFRGYPHETTDSLMIAAGLVDQLQTLVSRRVSPLEAAVVTVGTLHAGTAPNIIPGAANLTGTVRTLSEKLLVKIERELTGLVEHFARAHGGSAEGKYMHGSRALENHRGLVEFLKRPRPR